MTSTGHGAESNAASANGTDRGDAAKRAPDAATAEGVGGVIRRTLYKKPGSREQVPAQSGSEVNLDNLTGETVLLDRSGVEQITAERVTMDRSGARTIDAKSAQMDQSGVIAMSSDHAVLLNSRAVQIVADEARLTHSHVGVLSANQATLEHSKVLVFAGSTTGDVQPLLTTRSAAILGGALIAALLLLGLLLRGRGRD